MSLAHLGVAQLVMDSILSGCFSIPNTETTKPQKSMCGMAKRQFDLLAKNFFCAEFGEDQAEMSLVVDLSARMNDDVVDVNSAELAILLEQEIHGPLEGGGRVAEAKGHDAKLERAVAGLEGGAFAVLGDDLDLVEARTKVHFGEHAGTSHGVQALVYAGDGVHDFLCQLVEAAIVDAEAESAVVLLREKHASAERGVGWLDPAIAGVNWALRALSSAGFTR